MVKTPLQKRIHKYNRSQNHSIKVSDCILYIVAVIFPPVAVLLRSGFYSSDLLLNVLLTMLGFFPGLIHAFYYITVTSPLRRDAEYVYFYQQGWVDSERDAVNAGRRGYNGPREDMRTPLLLGSNNSPGEHQPTVNEVLTNQERQHRNSVSLKQGAPPPYSEMP